MKLADWNITKHALQRALQRHIGPDEILDAVTRPAITRDEDRGRLYCASDTTVVVVDPATKTIITVAPK